MEIFERMRTEDVQVLRIGKGIWPWFPSIQFELTQAALRMLEKSGEYDHEEVAFFFDKRTALRAIIAIHDSTLGRALKKGEPNRSLGGTRITDFLTPEEKEKGINVPQEIIVQRAIFNVLRLSRGMTVKSALAELNLGGAKGVIIADSDKDKRPPLLYQYGKCVNTFEGRFITGEDMNVHIPDADIISFATPYVAGLSPDNPLRIGSGDPSPFTALGVFQGMKAALEEIYGTNSFKGVTIAIQGIAGGVGSNLAKFLHEAGARLIGSGGVHVEKTKAICEQLGVEIVEDREKIYDVECDIFSPNAGGGILDDETIPRLKCKIIAGGANNQLLKPEHGLQLHQRGIVYILDSDINRGGLVNVLNEIVEGGYDSRRATQMVKHTYQSIKEKLVIARQRNLPVHLVAEEMAKERVRKGVLNKKIPKISLP